MIDTWGEYLAIAGFVAMISIIFGPTQMETWKGIFIGGFATFIVVVAILAYYSQAIWPE